MTSKLQVTLPKAIADRYGIRPGDEIEWEAAGDAIRIIPEGIPRGNASSGRPLNERLRLFDLATERLRRNLPKRRRLQVRDRGWKREDLYIRGGPH